MLTHQDLQKFTLKLNKYVIFSNLKLWVEVAKKQLLIFQLFEEHNDKIEKKNYELGVFYKLFF